VAAVPAIRNDWDFRRTIVDAIKVLRRTEKLNDFQST
jgi:hypothetical protein